MSKTKRTE